ncbi:MAG: hypothetical protein C6Y22_11055 [Hapalosiphonaceae cyanobacterium JJU2]|nr:MAG: hypothetical protein C6Y22_11055 [Hapalosiphonaceae cyanobacterium JJU2]
MLFFPISTRAIKLFVVHSNSRRDEKLRKDLQIHLEGSLQPPRVSINWFKSQTVAGRDWKHESYRHLNAAQVIVLLISPDFLVKDYCNFNLKNNQAAVKDYTKAINIYPKNIDAYIERGKAYFNLKRYETAVNDYTKAIDIDKENTKAHIRRGNARFRLKNYKTAIQDYIQVIRLQPNSTDAADAYQNLCVLNFELKRKRTAIQNCQNAVTLYGKYGEKDSQKKTLNILSRIQRNEP